MSLHFFCYVSQLECTWLMSYEPLPTLNLEHNKVNVRSGPASPTY